MTSHPSLQRDLSRMIAAAAVFLSLISGFVIFVLNRHALIREFDNALRAEAQSLASIVIEETPGEFDVEIEGEGPPQYSRDEKSNYFQITDSGGRVLALSPSMGMAKLPQQDLPSSRTTTHFSDQQLYQDREVRMITFRTTAVRDNEFKLSAGQTDPGPSYITVQVAKDRNPLTATIRSIALIVLGTTAVLAAAILFLVPLTVRRALRPLHILAADVDTIGPQTLHRRFETEGSPAELLPVIEKLNELLNRMEDSFRRERLFSSNVSHELRTPLTEARSSLDMILRWPDDSSLVRDRGKAAMQSLLEMQQLTEQLLALTRAQATIAPQKLEPTEIAPIVREIVGQFSSDADSRSLRVRMQLDEDCFALTNPTMLRSILRNLVHNAVSHSPEGASLLVKVESTETHSICAITNPAPDLFHEDIDRLFDDFWRKDAARTTREHLGLGLPLARALAQSMDSEIMPVFQQHLLTMILRMKTAAKNALPSTEPMTSVTRRQ